MIKLKQVKVKGVRGIVDGPDLHFDKGGLLLCGDNGTGKSSYIDAIEKVLTSRCSSLDRSVQSISWRKQGTHINCDESEIDLMLTDGNKDINITLDTAPSTLGKRTREFLYATQQRSFLLRRRTLLDFIDSKPSQRYQALGDFLGLDEFVSFEIQIKEVNKSVESEISAQKESKEQHELTLREHLKIEGFQDTNETTCLEVANEALRIVELELLKNIDDLLPALETIEKLLEPYKNMDVFQKTQGLADILSQVPKTNDISESANRFLEKRKKYISEEAMLEGHFYSEVLENGLAWILEDNLKQCPLCNNPITITDVNVFVKSRLENNKTLIELKQQQTKAHSIFLMTLNSFLETFKDIINKWQTVFDSSIPGEFNQLVEQFQHFKESHTTISSVSDIERDLTDLPEASLNEATKNLQATVKLKLDSFPDNVRYTELYRAKSILSAISVHLREINNLSEKITHLEKCKDQLGIITTLAENGRKNTVQQLLNAIVKIANKYFQKIHPGENIGNPEMIIPERGTGSIELTSKFHTESGDPRGHYSEGHIDSLGLCLFLAIRRFHHTQRPELSLLVLDDVLHSVDSNHRRDTANLIFSEFSDHQIIITTHDPLWFEYLKTASRNSKEKLAKKRIATWSLKAGPVWGDHLSNYEWLTSENSRKAKPADKVIKAGLLLEEMLQNLCNNLTISVPFNIRGDYTMN